MLLDAISLQRPLFQFVTVFSSVNLRDMVWEQYQQFAIPKIENATREFIDIGYAIPTLSPKDAAEQLATIEKIISPITQLRKQVESEDREEFRQFKQVTLSFFSQLDHINEQLKKAAGQSDSARAAFHYSLRNKKNPAIIKYLK